jgi:hypothetical protein
MPVCRYASETLLVEREEFEPKPLFERCISGG